MPPPSSSRPSTYTGGLGLPWGYQTLDLPRWGPGTHTRCGSPSGSPVGRGGHPSNEWNSSPGSGLVGMGYLSFGVQAPACPGGRDTWGCQQGSHTRTEAWRSGVGSEGVRLPGLPSRGPHGGSRHCRHSLPSRHAAGPAPPATGSAHSPQRGGDRICGQPAPVRTNSVRTRRLGERGARPRPAPHCLQSCHRQSPGPPAFQSGLAAATTRAPPAAHSPRHRAPGQGDVAGRAGVH